MAHLDERDYEFDCAQEIHHIEPFNRKGQIKAGGERGSGHQDGGHFQKDPAGRRESLARVTVVDELEEYDKRDGQGVESKGQVVQLDLRPRPVLREAAPSRVRPAFEII